MNFTFEQLEGLIIGAFLLYALFSFLFNVCLLIFGFGLFLSLQSENDKKKKEISFGSRLGYSYSSYCIHCPYLRAVCRDCEVNKNGS